MSETLKKKPAKYDDAETRKPGSTIETPYKHLQKKPLEFRDLAKLDGDAVIKLTSNGELRVVKSDD